jgi:hypothetical protein
MTVIALPASRKQANGPRTASAILRQESIDVVATKALEPVLQSVLSVVIESAGLLLHIAGFGVALVSGTEISGPNRRIRHTRPAAEETANVILFPTRNLRLPASTAQE